VPGFEDRAADWVRFARAEGHDSYRTYREAFFQLLPPPARVLAYMRALEAAGLVLEALREPALPGRGSHRRRRIPLFLLWRAAKPPIRA
jgi:hypothetical protein